MKILNITYNKGDGGLEEMYLRFNSAFKALKWQVAGLMPKSAKLRSKVANQGIQVICNNAISSSMSAYNPFAVLSLRKQIKKFKPDIVILHNGRALPLIKKAIKNDCKLLVVHHGGKTKNLEGANNIACIANYMLEELSNSLMSAPNLYYLPNFIEGIEPVKKRKSKSDVLNVGFIGRLEKEKGADILIQAASEMPGAVCLYVAGDGSKKEELIEKAKSLGVKANFIGWVSGEGKQKFFSNIDVLAVPSRHEPFGLVILEGWAAGIPVVASRTKGAQELIKDNKNGLLFSLEDAYSLKDALCHVAFEENEKMLAEASTSLSNYSKDEFGKKLEELCYKVKLS